MASFGSLKHAIYEKEARKLHYQSQIQGLNAYDRHKKFVQDYVNFYGRVKSPHEVKPIKTDQDTMRECYRFIISEEDDMNSSWEKRLVKRYCDKLFKEYCLADMRHYKKGKIGLRWRTEKEVISGKGHFICGNKECDEKDGLGSYEVNFSYVEAGESKQALVKLVACKRCAEKLVYRRKKERELLEAREKELLEMMEKARSHTKQENRDQSDMVQKEKYKRKREMDKREESSDDNDNNTETIVKGKKPIPSKSSFKKDKDENFDEFLEGMFP